MSDGIYKDVPRQALAREIVKNRIENLDGNGIRAGSGNYVHLVASNAGGLMIDVLRQAVMFCHFPNFRDDSPENRSRVTIFSKTDENGLRELFEKLNTTEEGFGNLLKYCVHTVRMRGGKIVAEQKDPSFTDIEVEIIGLGNDGKLTEKDLPENDGNAIVSVFSSPGDWDCPETILRERVYQFFVLPDDGNIAAEDCPPVPETSLFRARLVNMVYFASTYTSEIYLRDIGRVSAYIPAIKTFLFHTPDRRTREEWEKLENHLRRSNLYCADRFEYVFRSIGCSVDSPKEKIEEAVNKNILDLGRVEHARWNVEKLILGFRPPNEKERYIDETSFDEERADFRKKLKSRKVHIDICPYDVLRRIDHNAVKYDIFLMLAMPEIVKRVAKTKKIGWLEKLTRFFS